MQLSAHEAYVALNLLPKIGSIRVKNLLEHFSGPEVILRQSAAALARLPGIGQKLAAVIANWTEHADLETELRISQQAGVQLVTLADPLYPAILKQIYDPPLCLYVRGNVDVLSDASLQQALAVVGTRRLSRYGQTVTEQLTCGAVRAGMVIVSGLARGIDTAAHRETIANGGRTIAVLGGGLSKIYPPENVELSRSICENGAVITEQPMLFRADRRSLPMRNRTISGLSFGTLVVEAGAGSGALITAQQALDQGRLVFAVPGRIDSPQAQGCHKLLKDGARLVESIDDIIDELEFLPGLIPTRRPTAEAAPAPAASSHPALSDDERRITEVLGDDDLSVDGIITAAAQPPATVLRVLTELELKRVVRQLPGRRYELIR